MMASLVERSDEAPHLADHIVMGSARAEGVQMNEQASAVAIGPEKGDYYYGYFQEFGTAYQGAQPFARPAFDRGVDTALTTITRALWTELASRGISRSVSAPSDPGDSAFQGGTAGLGAAR
jgi:hypothetical protein